MLLGEKPIVKTLSGENLELYMSAVMQANGYYVLTDLLWSETSVTNSSKTVDILQLDIAAYFFSPFGQSIFLIECKGGGAFIDFFKFLGISKFLKSNSSFLVCNNSSVFDELVKLGVENGIKVFKPINIIETFTSSIANDKINLMYWSHELQHALLNKDSIIKALSTTVMTDEQKGAFNDIKKYNSSLIGKIWKSLDPRMQANQIAELFNVNKDFIRKILRKQKLGNTDTENAIAGNILCESASYVVLKAKIEYIAVAVRCAINAITSPDINYLDDINDDVFINVVKKMIENIQISCRLPQFLQFWVYQFGGILNLNSNEISVIGKVLNERDETMTLYFNLLEEVFSILIGGGVISWGLQRKGEILEFKSIPESIRGYGIFYREQISIDTSAFIFKTQWKNRLNLFFD